MPSWPTPGDRREDHAQAAGDAIGTIYEQAEQVIIAAIASLARKVALGSMLPKIAERHLQGTVDRVLSSAALQARAAIGQAMTGAEAKARDTLGLPAAKLPVPRSAQRTRELATLIDSAADTAAQAAHDQFSAIVAAITQVSDDNAS